jgi:hypothetical protein
VRSIFTMFKENALKVLKDLCEEVGSDKMLSVVEKFSMKFS